MADVANAGRQRGEGRAATPTRPAGAAGGPAPIAVGGGEAATRQVVPMPPRWPRWPALCWLLTRREAAGLLGHLPLYLATAVGLAVSSFVLQDQLAALGSDGPQALSDPLADGLWAATLVITLYLGLAGAVSLARERERGTLEVLFYAPVRAPVVVLSRFGGLLAAYAAALAVAVPCFAAVSWLSGFAFSAAFAALFPLAVIMGGPALSLGLLVSCAARRLRGAIVAFAAIVAALLAVDLGQRAAGAASAADGAGVLDYGRSALAALAGVLGWLSPFAYLSRLVDPFTASGPAPYAQAAAGALLYTALLLALAVIALRRRGVRP